MHPNEIQFKKDQTADSEGLEPVLTNFGRMLLFANGARMERVPVSGDWACILPGQLSTSVESGQYEYWKARHDNVKERFDELFTRLDQHLQGSMANPGFPPPEDKEWARLERLRKVVLFCRDKIEKYRPANRRMPSPSPEQMEMSTKAESMKRELHRLRV